MYSPDPPLGSGVAAGHREAMIVEIARFDDRLFLFGKFHYTINEVSAFAAGNAVSFLAVLDGDPHGMSPKTHCGPPECPYK
jgi:hypothetical protein